MTDALVAGYAAVVSDLDGVVYRGPRAVPHAVEALRSLEAPVVFATNNASRTAREVAAHLEELGIDCTADDVVTSSHAAAWLVVRELGEGAPVLAVGGDGVAVALEQAGLTVVRPADPRRTGVRAVVQGYGVSVRVSDLAEAAYAVEHGARWFATNTDPTLPTERGIAPGNGSLVAAVATAVGHRPHVVAGKPEAPLYALCAQRLGVAAADVLTVGDRLTTDVAGAAAAGMDSLLVLTGVDGLEELFAAPPEQRPTHVATDLRSLHRPLTEPGSDSPAVAAIDDAVARVHRAQDADASSAEVERLRQAARDLLAGATPR